MHEGDPHWLRLLTANDIENEDDDENEDDRRGEGSILANEESHRWNSGGFEWGKESEYEFDLGTRRSGEGRRRSQRADFFFPIIRESRHRSSERELQSRNRSPIVLIVGPKLFIEPGTKAFFRLSSVSGPGL